jgi:ribonuclease D
VSRDPASRDWYIAGVIDSAQRLSAFLQTLRTAEWLAIDTEADSLHAYPEKLCLIQISTTAGDELIDPLARFDVAPLFDAIAGQEIVMHAADYDLRMLKRHHAFTPRTIFDTMLASRLLGDLQFGYSHLVLHYLGIPLEKGAQKANWAVRPLAPRLEEYARNDTRYLKPLADRLTADLETAGRLAWHREACARLIRDSTRPSVVDPDAVWRIRGSHTLDRRGLAVLRALWHWREREAVAADRPPFFVMSHEVIVAIAAAAAARKPIDALLPAQISAHRRAGAATVVAEGLAVPEPELPQVARKVIERLSDAEQKRVLALQTRRDARATDLKIDPTLIANRTMLTGLARNWEEHAGELMAWQRELMAP